MTPPPAGATPGEELYQKGQIWGLSERLQLRGHAGGAVAMEHTCSVTWSRALVAAPSC